MKLTPSKFINRINLLPQKTNTLLLASCFVAVLFQPCSAQNGYIRRDGKLLRDEYGRALLLRGLNYTTKDKQQFHHGLKYDTVFIRMKNQGYNSVRLAVNREALEPSANKYNENFLTHLDSCLQYAKQQGIYVILTMHPDLNIEKYGDTPQWPAMDEEKIRQASESGRDARYLNTTVQTAFDNFWANKPASDGMGVQEHYIKTWTMLAERYKNDKNIIGFDVMNEPFIGSEIKEAFKVLMSKTTRYLNHSDTNNHYTTEEVLQLWMTKKGREYIQKTLKGSDVIYSALKGMEPIYRHFEETRLMPFYKKLAMAIRVVNDHHILFWEPGISANPGISSYISPVPEAGNQQGFMPHVYDIGVDTHTGGTDTELISYMFSNLQQTTKRLNLPTIIGEWGTFNTEKKEMIRAVKLFTSELDSLLIGDFYREYHDESDLREQFKEILQRPYMQAVAGTIITQTTGENSLSVTWKETPGIKAPGLIYLPHARTLKVIGKVQYKLIALNDRGWDILEIAPIGKNKVRKLEIFWND